MEKSKIFIYGIGFRYRSEVVVENFLSNNKSQHYKVLVEKLVKSNEKLGCLMNLKLHFIYSHQGARARSEGKYL